MGDGRLGFRLRARNRLLRPSILTTVRGENDAMMTEKRLNEIVQALFKCKAELQKRFPFVCWFAAGWFPTAADAEYLRCPPVREGAYVNVELFRDKFYAEYELHDFVTAAGAAVGQRFSFVCKDDDDRHRRIWIKVEG